MVGRFDASGPVMRLIKARGEGFRFGQPEGSSDSEDPQGVP